MHFGRFPLKWPRSHEGLGGGAMGKEHRKQSWGRAVGRREACLRSRSNQALWGPFSKAQLLPSNKKVGPAQVP